MDEQNQSKKEAEQKTEKPQPAAKKPAKKGPSYQDLEQGPLLEKLKENFPEAILSAQSFLDQPIYTVRLGALFEVMVYLRDSPEWSFDYLIDVTALDEPGEEKRFCIVYHLYSYKEGQMIRLKARAAEGERMPSVCSIWKGADWLEREVFDMFGIEFSGHPDLRRILLPDDWHGYPLRKDYDIKLQDQAWIKNHLQIRKVR